MKRIYKFKNQAGFTMLEIIITVVIIGILSSMAVPRFLDFIQRTKSRANAVNNVAYLRAARSQAITNGIPTGVNFDVVNKQVLVFSDLDGNGRYSASSDSITMAPLELAGDTQILNCTFPNNSVVFNTNGSANASGQIEFSFNSDSARTFLVNVLASTGRAKLTAK